MNKQAILDVLNSLEVIETNGGDSPYCLVANNEENRSQLNAVGVTDEVIRRYGDDETFCIWSLAFSEGYADEYSEGKLILWGPIDDELRKRVLNGEGDSTDAERLLQELELRTAERDAWKEQRDKTQARVIELLREVTDLKQMIGGVVGSLTAWSMHLEDTKLTTEQYEELQRITKPLFEADLTQR